jgi:hypothetical protein
MINGSSFQVFYTYNFYYKKKIINLSRLHGILNLKFLMYLYRNCTAIITYPTYLAYKTLIETKHVSLNITQT